MASGGEEESKIGVVWHDSRGRGTAAGGFDEDEGIELQPHGHEQRGSRAMAMRRTIALGAASNRNTLRSTTASVRFDDPAEERPSQAFFRARLTTRRPSSQPVEQQRRNPLIDQCLNLRVLKPFTACQRRIVLWIKPRGKPDTTSVWGRGRAKANADVARINKYLADVRPDAIDEAVESERFVRRCWRSCVVCYLKCFRLPVLRSPLGPLTKLITHGWPRLGILADLVSDLLFLFTLSKSDQPDHERLLNVGALVFVMVALLTWFLAYNVTASKRNPSIRDRRLSRVILCFGLPISFVLDVLFGSVFMFADWSEGWQGTWRAESCQGYVRLRRTTQAIQGFCMSAIIGRFIVGAGHGTLLVPRVALGLSLHSVVAGVFAVHVKAKSEGQSALSQMRANLDPNKKLVRLATSKGILGRARDRIVAKLIEVWSRGANAASTERANLTDWLRHIDERSRDSYASERSLSQSQERLASIRECKLWLVVLYCNHVRRPVLTSRMLGPAVKLIEHARPRLLRLLDVLTDIVVISSLAHAEHFPVSFRVALACFVMSALLSCLLTYWALESLFVDKERGQKTKKARQEVDVRKLIKKQRAAKFTRRVLFVGNAVAGGGILLDFALATWLVFADMGPEFAHSEAATKHFVVIYEPIRALVQATFEALPMLAVQAALLARNGRAGSAAVGGKVLLGISIGLSGHSFLSTCAEVRSSAARSTPRVSTKDRLWRIVDPTGLGVRRQYANSILYAKQQRARVHKSVRAVWKLADKRAKREVQANEVVKANWSNCSIRNPPGVVGVAGVVLFKLYARAVRNPLLKSKVGPAAKLFEHARPRIMFLGDVATDILVVAHLWRSDYQRTFAAFVFFFGLSFFTAFFGMNHVVQVMADRGLLHPLAPKAFMLLGLPACVLLDLALATRFLLSDLDPEAGSAWFCDWRSELLVPYERIRHFTHSLAVALPLALIQLALIVRFGDQARQALGGSFGMVLIGCSLTLSANSFATELYALIIEVRRDRTVTLESYVSDVFAASNGHNILEERLMSKARRAAEKSKFVRHTPGLRRTAVRLGGENEGSHSSAVQDDPEDSRVTLVGIRLSTQEFEQALSQQVTQGLAGIVTELVVRNGNIAGTLLPGLGVNSGAGFGLDFWGQMRVLDLSGNEFEESSLDWLTNCKMLEMLVLNHTCINGYMTAEVIRTISEIRTGQKSVDAVQLRDTGPLLIDHELQAIAEDDTIDLRFIYSLQGSIEPLGMCTRLKVLLLADTNLSGSVECLVDCKLLKEADFSGTNVEGQLSMIIENWADIESLNLANTLVVGSLDRMLIKCRNLTSLNVDGCELITGVTDFHEAIMTAKRQRKLVHKRFMGFGPLPFTVQERENHEDGKLQVTSVDVSREPAMRPAVGDLIVDVEGVPIPDHMSREEFETDFLPKFPRSAGLVIGFLTVASDTDCEVVYDEWLLASRIKSGCGAIRHLDYSDQQGIHGSLLPLSTCFKLMVVDFQRCKHIRGTLEPIAACKLLEVLNVAHTSVVGGLEPLMHCKSLRVLNCSRTMMHGTLAPLAECTKLLLINISGSSGRKMRLTGDLIPLRHCKELRMLCLYHTQLFKPDVVLTETKQDKKRKTKANIRKTRAKSAASVGAVAIGRTSMEKAAIEPLGPLRNLTQLQTLNVGGCIHIEGGVLPLKELPALEFLNISECEKMTPDLEDLVHCPNLKFVSCEGNVKGITMSSINAFKRAHPHCKLFAEASA